MNPSFPAFVKSAQATRGDWFGTTFDRYIKVNGAIVPAVFSPPRLVTRIDESTITVDIYTTIAHVLKSDAPHLTTSAAWKAVTIQLPEGTSWRTYKIIGEAVDVEPGAEWKLNLESL